MDEEEHEQKERVEGLKKLFEKMGENKAQKKLLFLKKEGSKELIGKRKN